MDPASIDTRQPDRDTHLRSGDFFDVEHFPFVRFESTFPAPLRERCEALAGGSFDAREIAARVPADLLQPLFDEAQWELVGRLFGPRREVPP